MPGILQIHSSKRKLFLEKGFGLIHASKFRLVLAVRLQSPTAIQGVNLWDTVISMNGKTLSNSTDYDSTRQNAKGKPVTLVLQRGKKQTSYQVPPIAWGLSLGMRSGKVLE
ncbi:MAG TPA: hypothetical protein DEF45_00145 [Rhodopirellula sp.]|nr:hypothetical protein [Rhodopirellula sp.]